MLGRILPSKRLRREAKTKSEQAAAALAEIEEMADPAEKEKATIQLLRSLSLGPTVDRLRMQGVGINPEVAGKILKKIDIPGPVAEMSEDMAGKMGLPAPKRPEVEITPDVIDAFVRHADSKPLAQREFGEQADRYDGQEPVRLPPGERASLRKAMDHIGGVNKMVRKPGVSGKSTEAEISKILGDLARKKEEEDASKVDSASPIGEMSKDMAAKMGIQLKGNGEREVTDRERFDARRLLKKAVPEGFRNNTTADDFELRPERLPVPGGVAFSASEAEGLVALEKEEPFWGSVGDELLKPENQAITGSLVKLNRFLQYGAAAHRLQDMANYPLRERDPSYIRDRQMVLSKDNEELLEAYRAEKGGWKYFAKTTMGQMPGFVAEMSFTSGAFLKVGNAVRRMVLRELADQSFKQVARRGLGRAVAAEGGKWLAGSMAQAAAMPWRTASGTAERMLPREKHFGEDGGLVVDEAGDEFGKAMVKAYVDNAIEVSSEHAGDAIEWVLKSPFRLANRALPATRRANLAAQVLEKTRWTRRELSDLTNIAKGGGSSADMATFRAALRQLPDGAFEGGVNLMPPKLKAVVAKAAGDAAEGAAGRRGGREFMKAVSERAGFQPLGEYGEELLGDTARVGLGINDSEKSRWEQLKDVWAPGWDQFIGVNLGFAPMGLLTWGGQSMAQVKSRHDFVRLKAERLEAWKKANGDSGEQSSRKWLDRYALAESPQEWQQLERAEFGEAREAFAQNAEQSGAVKGAVEAVKAAENWQELESAWKQATAESLDLRKKAMAVDVREKGLGEDLAGKFESAKTQDDFNAAVEQRFRTIRDGHAAELEKAGRKGQAERVRLTKNDAEFEAAKQENLTDDFKAGATEMVKNGYAPVEVEQMVAAQSMDEFHAARDSARFMRTRRELADSVEKAPGGAERAAAIRSVETGDAEALEAHRMEAFRDFALPELLEKAALPRELAGKTASASNFQEMSMALAEAIAGEMQAPASGLPSYLAESILVGDAELAVYFGTLRQYRLQEWKGAIAGNVSKWAAAAPGAEALLWRLQAAGTEAEVAALAAEAEQMRQEARKRGLSGAAAAVAMDAAGAEDAASRIVEAMANGDLSAAEAIRRVAGTGGSLPGIPADPMPPIDSNPIWRAMARPDPAAASRAIVAAKEPAVRKVDLINAERSRLGLPPLSSKTEAALVQAMEAGVATPRMVVQAIQLREETRRDAAEAGKKAAKADPVEAETPLTDGPAESPEERARRRGTEIVALGDGAEETVARIERERAAGGLGPLEPAERGAALRALREGVFTAERAAELILGRQRPAPAPDAPKEKRRLFGIPVSKRKPAAEAPQEADKPKKDSRVELRTPQGNMRVQGNLVVVDLFDDVASSYDGDYEIKALQNRVLDGLTIDDMEPRVEKIIAEFDHRELMGSTTSESGPPVVKRLSGGGRLNVLSGNGRVKALRLMNKRKLAGKLAAYVKAVRAEAAERGIDIPEGVKVPLLAIEMGDGYDLDRFVYLSNKDKIDGFNAYETALNDADVIVRENLLEKFVPGEDGDILTEENRPFWAGFVEAVGGRKELYDSEGAPNDLLEPRIRRAVLAALLKNRPNGRRLVQALIERGRTMGAKAQVTAIMAAAGPVLQVEAEKPGLSIANEFAAAVEMFLDYKANEGSGLRKKADTARAVEKYLASPQLFHVERGAVEKTLFRILANSPGVTAIRERFKAYAQSVAAVDTTSGDLFGANDAAATAARDRTEKIRLLELALGVQVEDAEAAKPARKSKPFMRSVSERKAEAAQKARPTVEVAMEAARRLGMAAGKDAKVHFVAGLEDLPANLRQKLEADANYGPNTKAFTMGDGSVWIFVPRHRDMADVLQSLLHEDLEAAMLPLMESPGFAQKLDQAFEAAGLTAAYAQELRNVVGQYNYVADAKVRRAVVRQEKGWEDALHTYLATHADARREVMRELLAHVRQRRAAHAADAQAKGMWEAIVEAIRGFLADVFGVNLSHADMQKNVPAIESLIDEIAGAAKPEADADGTGARMRNEAEAAESEQIAGYEKQNGNILNADRAKLMFSGEGYNPASAESVVQFHKPAVGLVNRLFRQWLQTKKNTGDGTVTFLGGGNGAGKSTIATAFSSSDFVFDSTMASLDAIRGKIRAVIENGETPKLVFVHRNPVDAWKAIAYRAESGGHVVPKNVFMRTHALARKAFLALADEFDGKAVAEAFENSTDGPIRRMSLLELRSMPDYGQEQVSKEIEHAEQSPTTESRKSDGERPGKLEAGQRPIQESQGAEGTRGGEEDGEGQVARFRNEEDSALSAVPGKESPAETQRREEARLAGKMAAEGENVKAAMDRYTRLLKKIWPSRGKVAGVEEAQKALRTELGRIKKIPSTARKEAEWLISSLANKEGSELRTAVLDVLKEMDALSGFDPAISEAAFEMFADPENAANVLEAMGEEADPEAAREAAKKLRWAAPIYRKGVRAGWTASEKDSLFAFFHHREKMAKRKAGKFGIDNRLLMDWKYLSDGMESVREAAKEETRLNRARRTLKDVLGPDGMERMAAVVERDPVEALRGAASAVRALVFEKHAGQILDSLGGPMLLSGNDVSYFVHNLESPSLEDMAFHRLHPSVKAEMRELLAQLPWQAVFAQKALEHAEKQARELGGEYDGMKADRIAAVRAKHRRKILEWLETKEPIELIAIQTKLNGLLQESLNARAFVLAGLAKQARENATAIDREAREAMPEIKGQDVKRAVDMPLGMGRLNTMASRLESFAIQIGGGRTDSTAYRVFFENIHEGRDKAGHAFMRQFKTMEKWYKDNGISEKMRADWRGDVKERVFTLQPAELDAQPVVLRLNLTEAELMDLAAHLMDDETLVDIARGARVGPGRLKTTSNAPHLPSKALAYAFRKAVMDALSPEQRKVVARMVESVSSMAAQVNAMSRLLEGRDLAYAARHWSRRRDMGDSNPEGQPEGAAKVRRKGLAESSGTKERTSNVRGLYLRDVFDHFDEQLKWAAAYSHFALPQKMAKAALYYRADKRARAEDEADLTLDLRDTLARRLGEKNLDFMELTIDRIAGNARLDEGWNQFQRIVAGVYRGIAASKLAIRPTSMLNNAIGGSMMMASRFDMLEGFSAGNYWVARARVSSPAALASKDIKAIREALMDNWYFWNRIEYNRLAIQTQHLYEGEYDRAKKQASHQRQKWMSKALSGMSAQELHNAMAAVLALHKKGWGLDRAIQWVQRATELTQNPATALEESRAYVAVKQSGWADMFFPYFGQLSTERNLMRREWYIWKGLSDQAQKAQAQVRAARRLMDARAEASAKKQMEALQVAAAEARRNFRLSAQAVSSSIVYTAIQNGIIRYLKYGAIPFVSAGFWLAVLSMVRRELLSRVSPLASTWLFPMAKEVYETGKRLVEGQRVSGRGSRIAMPRDSQPIAFQTMDSMLRALDEIQHRDPVRGGIMLLGPGSEVTRMPFGGLEQVGGVGYGIYTGATEGWKTDIRQPVSKRGKGKK